MFVYLLFSLSIVSGCYAMVNKEELQIQQITNAEKLKYGLQIALAKVEHESNTPSFPAELKEGVRLYREKRFAQLQTRTNSYDMFMYQNEEDVGFLASHLDNDPSRVILDNFYAKTSEDLAYLYTIAVTHLQTIYPGATKIWLGLIKYDASNRFAQEMNLKKSPYMDTLHDEKVFQGWEQDFFK